jgi:diacylglycerol kinase
MSRTKSLKESFGFAFAGLREAISNEPNFQIHLSFGVAALIFAAILGFDKFEWLLLLFTISFVLIMELVNTVLEAIVDLVSPGIQPKAKIAKDVSAAAVLVSAAIAIIVGLTLFAPKLFSAKLM